MAMAFTTYRTTRHLATPRGTITTTTTSMAPPTGRTTRHLATTTTTTTSMTMALPTYGTTRHLATTTTSITMHVRRSLWMVRVATVTGSVSPLVVAWASRCFTKRRMTKVTGAFAVPCTWHVVYF